MRVAIFAGPTGGHLFPALAFAEALRKKFPESKVLLVTGERGCPLLAPVIARRHSEQGRSNLRDCFVVPLRQEPWRSGTPRNDEGVEFLPDFPFPRPNGFEFFVRFPRFLIKLAGGFRRSRELLERFRPELAVGFGSYLSFPGLWLSRRRRIPILIHEQNRRLGWANAWLARGADRVAVSFEETKGILTGFPLRSALVEAAAQRKEKNAVRRDRERLKILVLGGSQGSRSLNGLWKNALAYFTSEEKSRMAVIHITGEKDFKTIQTMYRSAALEASVFPFHPRMEEIYSEVDLAFTRAGAGTLFELALFSIPALVVPYPHASRHQGENAECFEREGAVRLLPESEASPIRLRNEMAGLMNSESLRSQLSEGLKRLARPDAAERLVETACQLLETKESCPP